MKTPNDNTNENNIDPSLSSRKRQKLNDGSSSRSHIGHNNTGNNNISPSNSIPKTNSNNNNNNNHNNKHNKHQQHSQ
eukprot:UN00210